MSASPISISSVAPAHDASSATKQADNDSSGESFSQALTREISERQDASQASEPSRPTGPADQKTAGKAAKTDKDQPAGDKDKDADKGEADDTASVNAPAGMLALMIDAHQLSGKVAPADKAGTSKGKPDAAGTQAIAVTTEKAPSAKPDIEAAAATDEKVAGTRDSKEKSSAAVDAQASSKTKSFAEDLREAGKDARQAGDTAKAGTSGAGAQTLADTRMENLQKAVSEHERASELRSSPAAVASLMSAQQAAVLHGPEAATAAASTLSPQVGTPAWDRALGQKIVWMVAGDQQSASLTLNPPDLGPLQVVLNVTNSMADATFITAQPEVRHALEQAMPKLREMMNEAGIQLGQANVNTGTPNGNPAPRDNFQAQAHAAGRSTEAVDNAPVRVVRSQTVGGQGLIDTFV